MSNVTSTPMVRSTKIRVWMRPKSVGVIDQIRSFRIHFIHCDIERPEPIRRQKPWAARSSAIRCAAYCRPRNESTPAK